MSFIINHFLPYISAIQIDRIIDVIWLLFLLLDAVAYAAVAYIYNIFQIIAQLNFSVISSWTQPLVNRVEALIMVLILFKLGMSFIQYMVNPDTFSDKSKGGTSLLINIVICSVLLVSYQFIFTLFNELSMLIIGYNENYEFTVLKEIADVTSEDGGDESGLLGRFIFGEEYDSDDFGYQLACITLFSFLNDAHGDKAQITLGSILDQENFMILLELAPSIYRGESNSEFGDVSYQYPIISTAAGLYLAYVLIVLTIEVAIRMFKLIILEVTAPIAIITTIQDGLKANVFKRFYTEYISIYLSLFIRVLVVYLTSALINMFSKNFDTLNIAADGVTESFVFIIIVVSLFTFAKKLPGFIDSLFGTKSDSGDGKAGFRGLMKSMGGALGLGVGAVGGMALGAAAGGVGGALGGLVGGGFRGATGGFRANGVSDFFKSQSAGLSTTTSNALRTKANGGFFKDRALRFGAATGINNVHNAGVDEKLETEEKNYNKAVEAENNSWKNTVNQYDRDQANWDSELERKNQDLEDLQKHMAGEASGFVGGDGKVIRYGDDQEKFVNNVVEGNKDVIAAQAALAVAQNGHNRDRIANAQRSLLAARSKAEKTARDDWKNAEDANYITQTKEEIKTINKNKSDSTKAHSAAEKRHNENISTLDTNHKDTNESLAKQKWVDKSQK